MRTMFVTVALMTWLLTVVMGLPAHAISTEVVNPLVVSSVPVDRSVGTGVLEAIISNIAPVSRETRVRRDIAQATFCLPQNVLGTLLYGLLQITGHVVDTAGLNEVKIVVTTAPFGASSGKYIFVHTSLLTEYAIRHEVGHTLQGYIHGPFYLLFEGLVSFVQAAISLISPTFADGYFDRWPENEATELGGIREPGSTIVFCEATRVSLLIINGCSWNRGILGHVLFLRPPASYSTADLDLDRLSQLRDMRFDR